MLIFEDLHVDICSSDSSFLLWFLLSLFALALILAMVSCYLWSKCYRYHRRRMCGLPCFANYWTLECVKGLWHWISLLRTYMLSEYRLDSLGSSSYCIQLGWTLRGTVETYALITQIMDNLCSNLINKLVIRFSVFAFVHCFDITAPLF